MRPIFYKYHEFEVVPANVPNDTYSISTNDNLDNVIVGGYGGNGALRVYTGGTDWTLITPDGTTGRWWYGNTQNKNGSIVLAGAGYGTHGVDISYDTGNTWVSLISNVVTRNMQISENDVITFVDVTSNYFYRSTNFGASWDITSDTTYYGSASNADSSLIYLTSDTNAKLYKSVDSGTTFSEVYDFGATTFTHNNYTLVTNDSGSIVMCATVVAQYISHDYGVSFKMLRLGNRNVGTSMSDDGKFIFKFLGTSPNSTVETQTSISNDYGHTWMSVPEKAAATTYSNGMDSYGNIATGTSASDTSVISKGILKNKAFSNF